jgi:hypothetical protein
VVEVLVPSTRRAACRALFDLPIVLSVWRDLVRAAELVFFNFLRAFPIQLERNSWSPGLKAAVNS